MEETMKLIKRLTFAALLALSLTPVAHATSYEFDDLDEIMPTFGWEETEAGDEIMPTF
jgi:hypothetical protein